MALKLVRFIGSITLGDDNASGIEIGKLGGGSVFRISEFGGQDIFFKITLNSDRLVFNSKGTDIHMFANRNLNLSANEEINLELGINSFGGRITLGDAESTNPMVLGSQLEDLFEELFSSVISFCNSVSSATGIAEVGDASDTMLKEMERMKINMPKILSDTVYICENQNEEITEINEVEGEVEQIVPVAGVAG